MNLLQNPVQVTPTLRAVQCSAELGSFFFHEFCILGLYAPTASLIASICAVCLWVFTLTPQLWPRKCTVCGTDGFSSCLCVFNLCHVDDDGQEQKDYRLSVIFLLQHLTTLDQQEVTAEEKVWRKSLGSFKMTSVNLFYIIYRSIYWHP